MSQLQRFRSPNLIMQDSVLKVQKITQFHSADAFESGNSHRPSIVKIRDTTGEEWPIAIAFKGKNNRSIIKYLEELIELEPINKGV